ncbi:MAG: hypothetical protein JW910_11160 [Anaerolineae bacterium]|nr:hypothetical protein [Anaerolineae bacterium]
MLQKMIVSVLALTVVGAGGVGIYDATQPDSPDEAEQVLAASAPGEMSAAQPAPDAGRNRQGQDDPGNGGPAQQGGTPIPQDATGPIQQQEQQSLNMVGDPWTATGTIVDMDATGITLALADGSQVYVELGPSSYWQAQGVMLITGDVVTVDGFSNGTQTHAQIVTTADGSQIVIRTADGQPLWSGGANAQGGTGTTGAGTGAGASFGQTQVAAEDWITLDGTVTAADLSTLTMQTQAGEMLTLQLGEPGFWQAQGITFAAGDAIAVLGFWEGAQFQVGEITKLATGERLMLRDPNGRPLWSGPGRSGTQGQGGQGQGTQGQGGQGQGQAAAQGQATAQGQGKGGQGGQGQGQAILVPATQWETLAGSVIMTEPLAFTLQLQDGTTARVMLGEMDFWNADGIWFSIGDALTVQGYWLNGQFEAGTVTFDATQTTLTVRDTYGRLLWQDTTTTQGQGQGGQGQSAQGGQGQGGQGGGSGYRGGRQ